MATTKIFLSNIEISPFFFQPQIEFCTETNIFQKKQRFYMQILSFCFKFLHNVVLDTQKLDFFSVSLDNFFKQATNSSSFCMACLHMACLKPYEIQCFSFGVQEELRL